MSTTQKAHLRAVPSSGSRSRLAGVAIAELCKAQKAVSFYPLGHPLCEESIAGAHKAFLALLAEREAVFVITRQGFSATDDGIAVEANNLVLSLARELFVRRILRLTFLADLTARDLKEFLLLLALEPQKIGASGGIAALMAAHGIRTIWANEIDISVILAKKETMGEAGEAPEEQAGETVAGFEGTDGDYGQPGREEAAEEPADAPLEELLSLMEAERNDSQYQDLGRMVVARAEVLKSDGVMLPLRFAMETLLRHHLQAERSLMQREYAVFTLQQVADGATTDYLLKSLEEGEAAEHEQIYPLLKILGGKAAYGIIQRICLAEKLNARKSLAMALVAIGSPAIAPLVAMLKDERWYVVRNMVSIIGELRFSECVSDLKAPLHHEDQRVRKETIRALMKIATREAEVMIITLLDDGDPAVVRHAVLSLGLMKSQLAVQPLMQIVEKRDVLLRTLPLKVEVIDALGKIGDKRAVPPLLWLFTGGSWLAWNRKEELKTAIARTLGLIGDESAIPMLKAQARRGGRLGEACMEAIDTIERLTDVRHD